MDNGNLEWSLPDRLPSLSPSSSVYSTNSDSHGPVTPAESDVLPGFHFSTTDEHVDAMEFHRVAAKLLGGGNKRRLSISSRGSNNEPREQHCSKGRDIQGRHCCSCGRSYSTAFSLNQHLRQRTGSSVHACPTCDKVFDHREQRDRHVDTRHSKEVCPQCGTLIPAGNLEQHLSDGANCDKALSTDHLSPSHSVSTTDDAYSFAARRYWIQDSQLNIDDRTSHGRQSVNQDASDPMEFVKQLLNPMYLPGSEQVCNLCGEMCSTEPEAWSEHLGNHSVDFCDKSFRCDDCQIIFADARDLDRHWQSATLLQHCGMTFSHSEEPCCGHHPPMPDSISPCNDHELMRSHLSEWEQTRLRSHRANIARLLATQLNKTTVSTKRMSVLDCRKTYSSLLPHMSTIGGDALAPIRESSEEALDPEQDEIEAEFCRIMSDLFPGKDQIPTTTAAAQRAPPPPLPPLLPFPRLRPDSALPRPQDTKQLQTRKSMHDFVFRRGNQDRRDSANTGSGQLPELPGAYRHKKSRTLGTLAPLLASSNAGAGGRTRESGALGFFATLTGRESSVSTSSSLTSSSKARDSQSSTRPSSVGTDILLTVPYDSVESQEAPEVQIVVDEAGRL